MPTDYDNEDRRLIMMVAQKPFELSSEATTYKNTFCKLIPIAYIDDYNQISFADEADFPNDGEVWWMLTPQTRGFAKPGTLVVGKIEKATSFDADKPDASQFQVTKESIQEFSNEHGCVIMDVPLNKIQTINDVIADRFTLNAPFLLTTQPSTLFLRWNASLYGPFSVLNIQHDESDRASFSLGVSSSTKIVLQIPDSALAGLQDDVYINTIVEISQTPTHRKWSKIRSPVSCRILRPNALQRLEPVSTQMEIEPLDKRLIRYSKTLLTRAQRQQLQVLLDSLSLSAKEVKNTDLEDLVSKFKSGITGVDDALDVVAKALLQSGLMGDDRIKKAEQEFAEKYIQERSAELSSKVEEAVAKKRLDLKKLELEFQNLQSKLQKDETIRRQAVEAELQQKREESIRSIAAEEVRIDNQKGEIERQRNLLHQNLQEVTSELKDAGDKVVNRFLTIAPLLSAFGNFGATGQSKIANSESIEAKNVPRKTFDLPSYISAPRGELNSIISEEQFFDRFRDIVTESGFSYRPIDLQRFHLSVKCGDLTVLGGPSGTGKSSLPKLYSMALLGDENNSQREDCLMVNVSPSWMDSHDLLGHLNILEGLFYPSTSGLFQRLVYSQEEYTVHNRASGLYLTCLDEMNLSQIEHYFSDFMMALERNEGSRYLQCFATEVVKDDCPFKKWGRIFLSPALRFVGTVNLDETTRLLSDRFLDRVNFISLASDKLPVIVEPSFNSSKPRGRMITLSDFDSWMSQGKLPSDLGALMDKMRPLLESLGAPLSPRVYRSICRFVGSSSSIISAQKAFDLQIAQRVVPKIRSIVTLRQRNALDDLLILIDSNSGLEFEETSPLLNRIHESGASGDWGLDD